MRPSRTDSSSFLSLKRYEDYYLTGGDLFFLVQNYVFRVHRYFFERESSYFRAKLATPTSPGAVRQGTSETNTIELEDIKVSEFARFLWVFYNPKFSLYSASVEDWCTILSLAHRWSFPQVKALAVRELEQLDMPHLDRIAVYHSNDVDRNLLISQYAALCEREEPLTIEEGNRLGLETTVMLARTREYARVAPADNGLRSPVRSNARGPDLYRIVRDVLGIPEPESEVAVRSPSASPVPAIHVNGASLNGDTVNGTTNDTTPNDITVTNGTPVNGTTPGNTLTPSSNETTLPTGQQKGPVQGLQTKDKTQDDLSRPQTPVQETPTTPTSKKSSSSKKKGSKNKQKAETAGSSTPSKEDNSGKLETPKGVEDAGKGGKKAVSFSKEAPTILGPETVIAGKNGDKREPRSRTSSSSNESDKEQVEPQQQQPEEVASSTAAPEMSEESAKKKVEEDSKEFFAVRNLDEAEIYFTTLPANHQHRLVDKLVSQAVELKEGDAQLVANLFARAVSKNFCSAAAFEEGFSPIAELIEDIAIDAPKAYTLFATMVKGAGLDEERRSRLASKSLDGDKLLALLS